ncbi:hypothetical protein B4098_0616 [Heyndrickxia coagulans]|uniref:Uncharacterized protein n=1 Tax=Heyndrickxia coagulans TaxID=1398 RepID=A0A150JTC6_HEYCO|nr:hypothetical protein B4098_0616 [Heyndrickxia coagulans]KYC65683.1 hypothetical protein B4099_0719 [Heyndrickxia coagulans]
MKAIGEPVSEGESFRRKFSKRKRPQSNSFMRKSAEQSNERSMNFQA